MKPLIITLFLLVVSLSAQTRFSGTIALRDGISVTQRIGVNPPTIWIQQTSRDDAFSVGTVNYSQFITNDSGSNITVVRVVARAAATGSTQRLTNSFYTAVNEGGSLIGSSTDTTITTTEQDYTWEWTANYPVITNGTACYLTFHPQNGAAEVSAPTGSAAGGTKYRDTVFAAYRGAVIITGTPGLGSEDLVFKIYQPGAP